MKRKVTKEKSPAGGARYSGNLHSGGARTRRLRLLKQLAPFSRRSESLRLTLRSDAGKGFATVLLMNPFPGFPNFSYCRRQQDFLAYLESLKGDLSIARRLNEINPRGRLILPLSSPREQNEFS